MRMAYRALSTEMANSPLGKDLQKNIDVLDKRLKGIDSNLGQYGRSVGNYKSQWDGLGNAITQLTREAPAFAVSLQTGFLAISNNIPILADQIQRIRNENAALRQEGIKDYTGMETSFIIGIILANGSLCRHNIVDGLWERCN